MNTAAKFLNSKYAPFIFILLVWALFAAPNFLQGEILFPSDYLASNFSPWSAYESFFSAVKNDSMPDVITQIYPWRFFAIESYKNLQIPLWNPYSFAGTPFLANYQSAVFSPVNLGFFIFPFLEWWGMMVLLQPLMSGVFTYMYARAIKLSKIGSIIPALSFMFCGFAVSWMAYATLVYAFLFLPLALFAIEKYAESVKSRYLFLLSFVIPLSLFSGHFQISLYFLMCVSGYIIFKLLQTKNVRIFIYFFFSVFCGILMSAIQLFPSIEMYAQSFRSTIFQKVEVVPWGYLPTLISPDFFGNPVTRNAWFGHYAEWNAYIGLIPLMLAVYSLFRLKNKYVIFFSIGALFSLLLSFQSPLLDLLVYLKIPVLSTSALSRILVVFSFSGAMLSGFGIDGMIRDIKDRRYRNIVILSLIFFFIFMILWTILLLGIFMSNEHIQIAQSNLRLPTLMLLVFLAALLFMRFIKLSQKIPLLLAVLILVITFDLLRFSLKWVPYESRELVFPDAPVVQAYKQISEKDRVFGNFGAENSVYYKLASLEGYDAVYIRRYGQFISYLDNGKLSDSARSGVELPLQGKHMISAANLLGVKYFVHKISDGQNVWEFPFWEYDPSSLKLLYEDKSYQILENTNAFPRAFLASTVIVEKNPEMMLDKMFKKDTNLLTTAFIEEDVQVDRLSSGSAQITSYTPNSVTVKTESNGNSFLVLTDSFFPGWNAYVNSKNGKKDLKIYRTDFAFRGVFIPKGLQTITFKYEPAAFRYGVITAILGLTVLIMLCVFTRKKSRRRN